MPETSHPNVVFIRRGQRRLGRHRLLRRPRADAAHRCPGRRGPPAQELQRRGAMHADALGDPERPPADPDRHLQRPASGGAGQVRARAVGVHARRAVLRCRVRHGRLRQVARRRRRGQAADRSGLRRVVRHQEHVGRGRIQLVPLVRRVRGRGSEDLGGREGSPVTAVRGLRPGDAAARRREDRGAEPPTSSSEAPRKASRSSPTSASRRCIHR